MNQGRYFKKLLISFTIVFLVPMIVMGVILFVTREREYTRVNRDTVDQSLSESVETWEKTVRNIDEFTEILRSSNLNEFNQILDIQRLIARLQSLCRVQEMIYDIFVFANGNDRVVTSTGVSGFNIIMNGVYQYVEWPLGRLHDVVYEGENAFVRGPETVYITGNTPAEMLTFFRPMYSAGRNRLGAVFYIVRQRDLAEKISGVGAEGSTFLVLDGSEVIFQSGDAESARLYLALTPDTAEFWLFNKRHFIVKAHSESLLWDYVYIVPKNSYPRPFLTLYGWLAFICFVLIGSGIFLIQRLFQANYQPVSNVFHYLANRMSNVGLDLVDFDTLKRALDELLADRQRLSLLLADRSLAAEQQFLSDLLNSRFESCEDANRFAPDESLQLKSEQIVCAAIAFHGEIIWGEVQRWHRDMSLWSDASIRSFLKTSIDPTRGVLLFSGETTRYDELDAVLVRVSDHIRAANGGMVSIGISGLNHSVASIHAAYAEAQSALEYTWVTGGGTINHFESIQFDISFEYPKQHILKINRAVRAGNGYLVIETIEQITQQLRIQRPPLFLAQMIAYAAFQAGIEALDVFATQPVFDDLKHEFLRISGFDTLDDLIEMVRRLGRRLDEFFTEGKSAADQNVIAARQIVEGQLGNKNLSLTYVSNRLNLSPSYLSTLFKQKMSVNIQQYIRQLRMEETKKLLRDTDQPLKAIIDQIGYTNISSFIRQFHRVEGVTPGEYRRTKQIQ